MAWQDPDEDEAHDQADREDPDESDMDTSDEPELIECPWCGKMILEESEWCHHCGKYQSAEDARKVSKLMLIGTLLVMLVMLSGMVIWLVEKILGR